MSKPKRGQGAPNASDESAGSGGNLATAEQPATDPGSAPAPAWESALDGQRAAPIDREELAAAVALAQPEPEEGASSPDPKGGSAPAPVAGVAPPRGPGRPSKEDAGTFHRWSDRRVKRATAAELKRYVAELHAQPLVAPAPAPEVLAVGATPGEQRATLESALAPSFGMVASIAGRVLHTKALDLTGDEQQRLAAAWAPLLLPYVEQLAAALPWAVALGESYSVLWPKVERVIEERTLGQAQSVSVSAAGETTDAQ